MRKRAPIIIVFLILLLCITYIFIESKRSYVNQDINGTLETQEEISQTDIDLRQMPMAKEYTTYTVEMYIDEEGNYFEGIEKINYTHEYEKATDQIIMSARPMIIKGVQVNAEPVKYEQKDSTISIFSPFEIQKGEEITVTIQFRGRLLESDREPSGILAMCNFLPTIVAYDENNGWIKKSDTQDNSYRLVEPANYEVTVHTQAGRYPVATGSMNDISEDGENITTIFDAKGVRNFGLIVGHKLEREVINTEVGPSIVLHYPLYDQQWEELVSTIEKSIMNYSEIFGTYPYDQLTVVQSKGISKAFTYPMLIVGDLHTQSLDGNSINQLVGQQWLYYIIGNSREKESWLSKGLLEYVNKKFSLSQKQLDAYIEESKTLAKEKDSRYVYQEDEIAIRMLYEIEQKIGEEKFIQVLRAYYKNYSFQMATGNEFIQMVERIAQTNVRNIYNYWAHKMELKESE